MEARIYFVKCSVIKYRKKYIALYPLGKDKEKIKHLRGKTVYVLVIAEDDALVSPR